MHPEQRFSQAAGDGGMRLAGPRPLVFTPASRSRVSTVFPDTPKSAAILLAGSPDRYLRAMSSIGSFRFFEVSIPAARKVLAAQRDDRLASAPASSIVAPSWYALIATSRSS